MLISRDMGLIGLRNELATLTGEGDWLSPELVEDRVIVSMRASLCATANGRSLHEFDAQSIAWMRAEVEQELAWRDAYLTAQVESWRPPSQGLTRAEKIDLSLVLAALAGGGLFLAWVAYGAVP